MVESGYHPELARESAAERSLRLMADEALALAPKFTHLKDAVWQVVRNNRVNEAERIKIHGEIMREIRRRNGTAKTKKTRSSKAEPPSSGPTPSEIVADAGRRVSETQLRKDAYHHEKRQPRDAYAVVDDESVLSEHGEETNDEAA